MKAICIFIIIISFLDFSCAGRQISHSDDAAIAVKVGLVVQRENTQEVNGFGSLMFLKKYEVLSPNDGILDTLFFREGDRVNMGDTIALLKNPQVNLAARRAEDAYSQALAALDMSLVRLRDSTFNAEIRILENEKFHEELIQAQSILEEEKRKQQNREALYLAGGLSDEAIREDRFRLANAENQILMMSKELEIRSIGLREIDLITANKTVPEDKNELFNALVQLATMGAKAEVASARASLEAAGREMESFLLAERDLEIVSPGNGIVGARYAEVGERIKREDGILTILSDESLYAIFSVPESEVHKIYIGMPASVISGGDAVYPGTVDFISPQADRQSFTFTVRVLLEPHADNRLRSGMFARVSIPIESGRLLTLVNESALSALRDNSARVFVVQGNIITERNVVLGSRYGEEREVISGLSGGEVVVLNPGPTHREGMHVSPYE